MMQEKRPDIAARRAGVALSQFAGIQSELSVRRIYEGAPSFSDSIDFFNQHGFELSAFVPNNAGHFPLLIEVDCILINAVLSSLYTIC